MIKIIIHFHIKSHYRYFLIYLISKYNEIIIEMIKMIQFVTITFINIVRNENKEATQITG